MLVGQNPYQDFAAAALQKAAEFVEGVKGGDLSKAITLASGITGPSLHGPLLQLTPLLTGFANSIPTEIVSPGSDAYAYKAITKITMPRGAVAERRGAALFGTTVVDRSNSYSSVGVGGEVTWEAEKQSGGFEPALKLETANALLVALRLLDMLGFGARKTAYAAPANPAVSVAATGGSIGTSTPFFKVAAVTPQVAAMLEPDQPADYDGTHANLAGRDIVAADVDVTAFNADGTGGFGIGPLSAEGTVTAGGGSTNRWKLTWDAVPGAGGYLVFVGTVTGNANLKLNALVTQASITLTSFATGGLAASTLVDSSADATSQATFFSGMVEQLFTAGSGAYIKNVAGKLTGTGGEVLEIQDAFASAWRTGRVKRFKLLVSGQDVRILTRLGIVQNSMNIVVSPSTEGRLDMTMGGFVGKIINQTGGVECPIEVQPNLPPGMIIGTPMEIPYNEAKVRNPWEWKLISDWERIEYGMQRSGGPVYMFEPRTRRTLVGRFPGGCFVLHNIFKG